MKPIHHAVVILLGSLLFSTSVSAADYAYMNDAEPWGVSSNVDAMNAAFGSGNWDKIAFGQAINSYKFVYIDGGDTQGSGFQNYVTSNQSALEAYVSGGGKVFLNAASNDAYGVTYSLIFGATTTEGANGGYSNIGYAAVDPANALFANGAGTTWNGNYFAHNVITTAQGYTSFITGDAGETIVAGGSFGSGYALIGGQTSTYHHGSVNGSNPFQLRVNELNFAATAVPEPETYAMMLAGLSALGFMGRRRRAG